MSGLHPPKVETFDTVSGINTDPKGFRRPVDRWSSVTDSDGTPRALYMARPADHPRFGYLESWLLPALDLRVNRFHFRNGSGHGPWPDQELYIDIARVDPPAAAGTGPGSGPDAGPVWRTTDLYIDVVTYAGGKWEILDLEELGDALVAGYLDAETTRRALDAAQRAVTGMVSTGSVEGWLRGQGFDLTWADPASVVLSPAEDAS